MRAAPGEELGLDPSPELQPGKGRLPHRHTQPSPARATDAQPPKKQRGVGKLVATGTYPRPLDVLIAAAEGPNDDY